MDPFYHTINPDYYNPYWRNRRERVKAKLTKAIFTKQLQFAVQGTHFIVPPGDFCYWALVNDLVSNTVVEFFLETKRLRPDRRQFRPGENVGRKTQRSDSAECPHGKGLDE